jgi:hypothetical protein
MLTHDTHFLFPLTSKGKGLVLIQNRTCQTIISTFFVHFSHSSPKKVAFRPEASPRNSTEC